MELSPYITITGNVSKFDIEERSFTMSPTQYVLLTHSSAPFPIHAHFADSDSKKRWGSDGPKVTVGSTVTLGGSLLRVTREPTIERSLQFAEIEVSNIAYITTHNFTSPIRTFFFFPLFNIY